MSHRNMSALVEEYLEYSDKYQARGLSLNEFHQVIRMTEDKGKLDSLVIALFAGYMAGMNCEKNLRSHKNRSRH